MFDFYGSETPSNNITYRTTEYYSDDFANKLNNCKNTNEQSKADFMTQNKIEGVSRFDVKNELDQAGGCQNRVKVRTDWAEYSGIRKRQNIVYETFCKQAGAKLGQAQP